MEKDSHMDRVHVPTAVKIMCLRFLIAPPLESGSMNSFRRSLSIGWALTTLSSGRFLSDVDDLELLFVFLFIAATLLRVERHLFWCFVRSVILTSMIG